jgi:hypothetical protein
MPLPSLLLHLVNVIMLGEEYIPRMAKKCVAKSLRNGSEFRSKKPFAHISTGARGSVAD